jgi:hypothetical protein
MIIQDVVYSGLRRCNTTSFSVMGETAEVKHAASLFLGLN